MFHLANICSPPCIAGQDGANNEPQRAWVFGYNRSRNEVNITRYAICVVGKYFYNLYIANTTYVVVI